MMLALLVMGVSNLFAQSDKITWTVKYTGTNGSPDYYLEYSNYYLETGKIAQKLGDKQVAVRLYLDTKNPEEVTDRVWYYPGRDAKVKNGKGKTLTTTTNDETTTTDDDNDGVGENATYKCLGRLEENSNYQSTYWDNNGQEHVGYHANEYFYERTHQVALSKATNVIVPPTVTAPEDQGGETYTVTAVQKWGFCYAKSDWHTRDYCENVDWDKNGIEPTVTETFYCNVNDHSNDYLQSVTLPNTITRIGDYAFMSCKQMTNFQIPNSVEYLGQGVFECCTSLRTVEFLTDANNKTKIETIKNFTFWYCTAMTSLELPDGIKYIEGTSGGAPLQYLFSLTRIRLPNTLLEVGPHFLCCAKSLTSLTIPANVTKLDGACFHGCESLERVDLLGPPSTLIKETSGGSTFDANPSYCAEHVNTCKFYVLKKYLNTWEDENGVHDGYKQDKVWSEIDEEGGTDREFDYDKMKWVNHYGNWLIGLDKVEREFTNKWVTAIFPKGVKNYKTEFGQNAKVAIMTAATPTSGVNPTTGDPMVIYDLTFTLINTDSIPAATPVMICPALGNESVKYTLYDSQDEADDNFNKEKTKEHPVTVTASDQAIIRMNGQYVPHELFTYDFFFSYQNVNREGAEGATPTLTDTDVAKFYRIPDDDTKVTLDYCRCYWTIKEPSGAKSNAGIAPSKSSRIFSETTGIKEVERGIALKGIYDLNGRKLDINPDDLPQGLFIVNGKKVIKK